MAPPASVLCPLLLSVVASSVTLNTKGPVIRSHRIRCSDCFRANMRVLATIDGEKCSVYLTRGKARLFYEGNPIVYPGAIAQEAFGKSASYSLAGRLVHVKDTHGNQIGWGVYNPNSLYRVRMLGRLGDAAQGVPDRERVHEAVRDAVEDALRLRRALGLPGESTSAYRLVNGEGDGLSGLTIDIFGEDANMEKGYAVVMSAAYWVEHYRDDVMKAISKVLPPTMPVLWRRQLTALKKDGWDTLEEDREAEEDGKKPESGESNSHGSRFIIRENGLRFWVDLTTGQKTGYYLDQRDNRQLIKDLSKGKDVLDLFCYSGGFALHAAAGGALSVVGVDSSASAVDLARENAQLLDGEADPNSLRFEQRDVFKFLKESEDLGKFDLVVCDPPKFAPSRRDLPKATRRYIRLNAEVMRRIRPGGLLLSCTCSGAMTQSGDSFINALKSAASEAGRKIMVLETRHAARDHVVQLAYPEGNYLTAVLLTVF
ncbi:hypothetical protein AAMO2058_001070700 [Amorphochlora amoebiformis]